MRIKKIISQSRRDFEAIYECENCGHEYEGYGYDDSNFHNNVIPGRSCEKCGKKSPKTYKLKHQNMLPMLLYKFFININLNLIHHARNKIRRI